MFNIFIKCIGFLRIFKSRINNFILSLIPSYISLCYYVDDSIITKKYNYITLNKYNNNKYYMFHIWNKYKLSTQYLYINEKLLYDMISKYTNLLYENSIINIKKYINIINEYINEKYVDNIFHIEINGKDVKKEIYKYKKSFLIPYNLNAKSLYLLNNIFENYESIAKNVEVKIIDYDLDEKIYKNDEYITNPSDVNSLV